MSDESGRSVTRWLESLKAGDADAAQKLWERYFQALVRLARNRLRAASRAVADEEDAALSAFDSFVRGARARPLSPARGPRRSLAAPGGHHRTQGAGPDPARAAAEARRGEADRDVRVRRRGGPGRGPGGRRGGDADARVRGDGRRRVPQPAGPAPRRLVAGRRPAADGGLHRRGDGRSARVQRAHGGPEDQADPGDLAGRGRGCIIERQAGTGAHRTAAALERPR